MKFIPKLHHSLVGFNSETLSKTSAVFHSFKNEIYSKCRYYFVCFNSET